MPVINSIAAAADDLTKWRHDLHRHPELGYEETRTAAVVAGKLHDFTFDEIHEGIGGTGVVGVLHGRSGPGGEARAIMLRADMDALPIREANVFLHRSAHDGVMHACGHDGHTVMLLGAARQLAETRAFEGSVYFCFQPAEENGPGAVAMIEDGLLERFPCRAVYGMHNFPGLDIGSFATRSGALLAGGTEFEITLTGRGGHAAYPHDARDPIPCGAAIVQSLQTIVSRRCDPLNPCVVSVTQFHAGGANNVISGDAVLGGTIRSLDRTVIDWAFAEVERIVSRISDSYDMRADISGGEVSYPPLVNEAVETEFCLDVAREVAGDENVSSDAKPSLGGEDFAHFALKKPACFILCGNGASAMLHHPEYDFSDAATPWGASYWVRLVERALQPL